MKKSILLTTLAAAVAATVGCSSKSGGQGATVPKFSNSGVMQNEFLVEGNKEDIAKGLEAAKVTGRIVALDQNHEEENKWAVTYKGDVALEDVMEIVAEKAKSIEPNRIYSTHSNLNRFEWP